MARSEKQETWLLIDGRNLLWRATEANGHLKTKIKGKKVVTGGMYGFLQSLIAVHERYGGKPIVVWEGTDNFRFKLYPEYKARTEQTPEEREKKRALLDDQQRRLKKMLRLMGVPQYTGKKCEADDVIGTLSTKLEGKVLIYTMDSDMRQLVNERIHVISANYKGDVLYDEEAVIKRHGVPPKRVSDLKALMGDTSDNVPGIKGVGEKTATKLLQTHGSLAKVINAAVMKGFSGGDFGATERLRKAIADNFEEAQLFHKLTRIKCDVEVVLIKPKPNAERLKKRLRLYHFRTWAYPTKLHHLTRLGHDGGRV